MPLVIPPGFAQVTHVMSLDGDPEPMVVTYGVEWTDQAVVLANATAGRLHTYFDTNINPQLGTAYKLQSTEIKFGAAVGQNAQVGFYAEVKPGTNTQPRLPQNCSVLVKKASGFGGRRHKGRFFLPGPAETNVDDNGFLSDLYQSGYQDRMTDFLNALIGDIDVAGMVILHAPSIKSPTPNPTPVLQLVVDRRIATQRRRLR